MFLLCTILIFPVINNCIDKMMDKMYKGFLLYEPLCHLRYNLPIQNSNAFLSKRSNFKFLRNFWICWPLGKGLHTTTRYHWDLVQKLRIYYIRNFCYKIKLVNSGRYKVTNFSYPRLTGIAMKSRLNKSSKDPFGRSILYKPLIFGSNTSQLDWEGMQK